MKRKISFSLFTLCIIFLIACTKNGNTTDETDQIPKIKAQTSAIDTISYTYDANGRVITQLFSLNKAKAEYTYSPGEVKKTFFYNGIPGEYYTFHLNGDGLAIKVTSSRGAGYTVDYTYNPDKTMSSAIDQNSTDYYQANYFYSNGNIDSTRYFDKNGNWTTTAYNSYYTDRPGYGREIRGENFWGKESKNMLKKSQVLYIHGNTVYSQDEHEYVYDTKGRFINEKITYIKAGIVTRVYTADFTYY